MNAREFRRTLNSLVAVAFVAALVIPAMTKDAPTGGWVSSNGYNVRNIDHVPANIPTWKAAYAARFPGCGPTQTTQLGDLVIVDQDAHVRREHFAAAWKANHNATRADDVWVVGWCH
jgi:hypothetical protein